jgi:hypothetical protein
VADKNNIKYYNKQCINNNIDTPDYCSFTVKGQNTLSLISELTNAFKNAGYSISDTTSGGGKIATNTKLDIRIEITVQPDGSVVALVSKASNPY